MMQGRKSRTVLVIGCSLAMFAAGGVIAPAFAGAQAAVDEYELGELPNPDGDNAGQSQSSEEEGAIAPTSSGGGSGSPTPPTGVAPDTTGAVVDANSTGDATNENAGGGGSGGGSGSGSGEPKGQQAVAATSGDDSQPLPAVNADPSDGGGAPVLLILLAITAALCAGVAIWRLRRTTGDPSKGVGRGGPGKTAETQSL
jgi:cobalamin biosynthesis Mg chelatase CobN